MINRFNVCNRSFWKWLCDFFYVFCSFPRRCPWALVRSWHRPQWPSPLLLHSSFKAASSSPTWMLLPIIRRTSLPFSRFLLFKLWCLLLRPLWWRARRMSSRFSINHQHFINICSNSSKQPSKPYVYSFSLYAPHFVFASFFPSRGLCGVHVNPLISELNW